MSASTEILVVEGFVASHTAGDTDGDSRIHQRVEVETRTGRIVAVGEPRGSGDLLLDDRHTILPGLIDIHVHAREDASSRQSYKETFRSAGDAAIHGGVTAFVEMPNNPVPPVDDESYGEKEARAKESCPVDFLLYAGVGPQTNPLSRSVPYKAYMGQSVGDLFFAGDAELKESLRRYHGQFVAFHAESPTVLERCRDKATHIEQRPPEAEWEAVATALQFSQELGIEPHICHLSTARGLELIREARRRGQRATCEVTPQHLFYDHENCTDFARPSFLQCNPPIRTPEDRQALLEGFLAGEIEYLATDHAPHSLEENERGISGMPHLDTYGAFLFWLRQQGATWRTLRLAASERPGEFLGRFLPDSYGKVQEGYVGSLTILREGESAVERESLKTRAQWSPFEGYRFVGSVSHTIVRGRVYAQ